MTGVQPRMKALTLLAAAVTLVSVAPAQAVKLVGSGGYGVASPYSSLYRRASEITYTGRVVGKTIAAPMPGMAESVTLLVKTANGGTSPVELGPRWFVANQVAKINVGDRVKVIGSKVRLGNRDNVVLARQVVDPRQRVLTLRDLGGAPYWAYNRSNQVTANLPNDAISGTILRDQTFDIDGVQYGGYVVETANGNVNIVTAPTWYLARQDFTFSPGNYITVVANGRVTHAAPYTYVADTVYGNGVSLVLFNGGVPVYQNFGGGR